MIYDFIVVGGGSSGAIIAARLSEEPDCSVLLIEAGTDYENLNELPDNVKKGFALDLPDGSSEDVPNWQYTGYRNKTNKIDIPRGKIIGGSSSINGQIFLRGIPEDYDAWAEKGNDLWSFKNLINSLNRIENDMDYSGDFHGNNGKITVKRFPKSKWSPTDMALYKSALEMGYPDCPDQNSPDASGVGPVPLNNDGLLLPDFRDGIRISSNVAYLSEARSRPNLTIKGNCFVRKILFREKGSNPVPVANGIEVESENTIYEIEGKTIILSAGSIGSPHLLLLSGIGPKKQLEEFEIEIIKDLPGVGKNLRDHPTVLPQYRVRDDFPQDWFGVPDRVCLRYTATGSKLRNDMIIYGNCVLGNADLGRIGAHFYGDFSRKQNTGSETGSETEDLEKDLLLIWRARVNLAKGKGELKLNSVNPIEHPYINYHFLENKFDMKRLREALGIVLKLVEHPSYKKWVTERITPEDHDLKNEKAIEDWMVENVAHGHHISGTCKMGPEDDRMSVVNQYGEVHGLKGLMVADASIMVDCIRANTNVTALMIGERIYELMHKSNKL